MAEPIARPAQADDVAAIARILRLTGAELGWTLPEDPAETVAQVERHLALCVADASHTVVVLEEEGEVVAYVAVHWIPFLMLPGPEGYVSEVFVHPERRGRGLGRRLLEVARSEGTARGAFRLQLANGRTRESYQRGFYRQAGWTERDFASFVLPLD